MNKPTPENDILYVTIKKEFFDQIMSGEKKEEYREPTDYWFRRLMVIENNIPVAVKPFKYIRLCVGYNKDREEAIVEIKDIYHCKFVKNIPEGFRKGDESFVIELGQIISRKNSK